MIEKVGHIRNPLSIIAIFAGLAEVSGTVVLPFLKSTSQEKYVWFLMLFPTRLVALFFFTLYTKRRVLYAPSDFVNEDNYFRKKVRPATVEEVAKKADEQIKGPEAKRVPQGSPEESREVKALDAAQPVETTPDSEGVDRAAKRAAEDTIWKFLAPKYPDLTRDVKLSPSVDYVFDGVAYYGTMIHIFELRTVSVATEKFVTQTCERLLEAVEKIDFPSGTRVSATLIVIYDRAPPPTVRSVPGRAASVSLQYYAMKDLA